MSTITARNQELLVVGVARIAPVRLDREAAHASIPRHHGRPDVTRLVVDRRRQHIASFED